MEFEKLQAIIADVMDIDDLTEIHSEARFTDDLGANSLDRMEIVMRLEDELGITIPDEQLEGIVTVQDAYEAIQNA